jgi:Mrp family chromosome partitioning ATPase
MAVIAFASAEGSPGVTTTLAALAAIWPGHRRLLVVELDPAGGDLAVWFDLRPEPGLVTLAAAGRRELEPVVVLGHSQMLPSTAPDHHPDEQRRVLVGPVAAEQAHAALHTLRGRLAPALARIDQADVLVDCGRVDPASVALEIFDHADLVVAVLRPEVSAVHHLSARLRAINPQAPVAVLTVGERPYSVPDVAEAVGVNPLGALPVDAKAAAALAGRGVGPLRTVRRSALLRTARTLADGLVQTLAPPSTVTADERVAG